uniref:DNA topoisomerase n=1 Tax=Meloidogyne enterolobii TaxID=390850 RepID=A0A6V7UAD6_MELEN|nr:unnamed protein product [Meloidogyne enterolobii]
MVSTSGQIDCTEVQKPIGPQPPTSSQLNKEVDEGEISDEVFTGDVDTRNASPSKNQQKETMNNELDAVTLSNLVRAPPPAVSRSVIVQALYLLIEHHNNKEKQTDLDEYTITCRLRSRNSATQGKEGAIVRHKDGPFNQTNHIFIASRLRDLEKLGRAKLVSSNARYEEIKQPAPMNLFTLIRIASERLNFSPKYTMELANRLHKSKLLTNPTTFAKAYPAGFPNEDFIKNIIKQADELCKLRVDTRLILANFVRPKSKELRGFNSNNTTVGGVNSNTSSVPIHPCILSTSENLETMLDQCLENDEMELLKLICQYFFATCLQPFTYSVHTFEFEAGPERFMCECQVLATPGFTTYLPWMRPPNVSDQLPEEFRKRNPSREYFVTDIKKVDLPKDVPEHILESEFIELLEKRAVGNSLILDTLNALVELKFVNIVGPGRRITPSATGLELMDQEYRKKIDQLGENVTQVESNIGDAQANSASHSSLDSTNTISSVSNNNVESNSNLNSKISAAIIPPIQRNFGFRRPLESTHSEFSDCSTRMSLRDFPLQKQQFPCRKQFQSELTLEQQNEQQSTPQLLQQLHIGLAEVPEENFNNKDRDSYRQQRANKNSSTSESNSHFHNRTNNEPFIVRDQNSNSFDGDIKQEDICSVENSSPSKSETLQQQHRWSWMATISSLSTKRRSFPPKNQEKNREWHYSAGRSNKSSVTDDDFGQYTSKRVRFESPKFKRSASMAPSERYKENNNLLNSSRIKSTTNFGNSNSFNNFREVQQRTCTPRRRSPSPERRRSQYRNNNFSNRDHNKFSSRYHDRQQNNFCSSSYQKPQIGTKRPPSDDSDSPVKSFKQQLLNQQRQQKNNDYYPQQRQSRYDSHIRDRDFDRGRRGFQNQQSERFSNSRNCQQPPQSSHTNSYNDYLPRGRPWQPNYQQQNNINRQQSFYQNQQKFNGKQQQTSKSSRPLADINTVPTKRGKWVWVDDNEGN